MKNSDKFWIAVLGIALVTLIIKLTFVTCVVLGVILTVLVLVALIFEYAEGPTRNKEEYHPNWRVNIVYWVRRFNKWLDNL